MRVSWAWMAKPLPLRQSFLHSDRGRVPIWRVFPWKAICNKRCSRYRWLREGHIMTNKIVSLSSMNAELVLLHTSTQPYSAKITLPSSKQPPETRPL